MHGRNPRPGMTCMRWLFCLSLVGIPIGLQGGDGRDPELASLPETALPELLVSVDGERIVEAASWSERRVELRKILEFVEYGRMPPRPDRILIAGHRSLFRPDLEGREERLTLIIGSQTRIPNGFRTRPRHWPGTAKTRDFNLRKSI